MAGDRESLLTTLRSRRKLYLWLYFLQIVAWLTVVIIYEVSYAEPAPTIKHAIDIAVTMSFIAPGVFVSTIFLVDVVIDGIIDLAKRGWEIMGLLFTPRKVRNIWQGARREDRREARRIPRQSRSRARQSRVCGLVHSHEASREGRQRLQRAAALPRRQRRCRQRVTPLTKRTNNTWNSPNS